jgi:alpha-glucosidase
MQQIVREMRALMNEYRERVLIGEIYLPIRRLVSYYGTASDGAHLPFNFQLITLPWNARQIAAAVSEYEGALPPNAWPNWVLGNHDQPRVASRIGLSQARVAAVLLLTLRGTPTLYYGDELGMRDAVIFPEDIRDPQGKNIGISRDPARTPMQWSSAEHAGFSRAKPWLPLGHDYPHCNVDRQSREPDSLLSLYRRLIELRRREPALCVGSYRPLVSDGDVLAYVREAEAGHRFLVALNLGPRPGLLSIEALGGGQVLVATEPRREAERVARRLILTGDDALVVRLDSA